MINFVLTQEGPRREYYCDLTDSQVTQDIDSAIVFRAEVQDGKLKVIGAELPKGPWVARSVQFFLKKV